MHLTALFLLFTTTFLAFSSSKSFESKTTLTFLMLEEHKSLISTQEKSLEIVYQGTDGYELRPQFIFEKMGTLKYRNQSHSGENGKIVSFKLPLLVETTEYEFIFTEPDGKEHSIRFLAFWKRPPGTIRARFRDSDGHIYYKNNRDNKITLRAYAQAIKNGVGVRRITNGELLKTLFYLIVPEEEFDSAKDRFQLYFLDQSKKVVFQMQFSVLPEKGITLPSESLPIFSPGTYSYRVDYKMATKVYIGKENTFTIVERSRSSMPSELALRVSVGVSTLSYKQTDFNDYSSLSTTLKIAGSKQVYPKWHLDLGGSVFINALPISNSPSSITMRTFGANLRLGYLFPRLPKPWFVGVYAGLYYSTQFVSGESFGYRNLLFAEFYPSISRQLTENLDLGVYLKYAPLGSNLFGFTERELAFGVYLTRKLMNNHPLSIEFDVADLALHTIRSEIKSQSLTLSVAYGF